MTTDKTDIGMSLTNFLIEEQRNHPESKGDFTGLFAALVFAGKKISREVNKAGLAGILGSAGTINVQGEEVQKLDDYSNHIIVSTLESTGHVAAMASEEIVGIIPVPENYPRGKYILLFDPLDGSSNIDVNISVGTIFSILRKKSTGSAITDADFLQPGTEQVCAGYIIYGSSTMLVYTTGLGVHGFTLDPSVGEFLLSHKDIKTPSRGNIYSINEGNTKHWQEGTARYVEKVKNKELRGRYVGSLVADFHRNLLKGGIFLYPSDRKNKKGKLRLLYEASPLAFIAEQAGGAASTGDERIMEIVPDELHQRTSLIIGSREDVEEAERFWQGK